MTKQQIDALKIGDEVWFSGSRRYVFSLPSARCKHHQAFRDYVFVSDVDEDGNFSTMRRTACELIKRNVVLETKQ